MKHILWLLRWLLKAAIFFTLFAFALNNQQFTTVHFFFGNQWQSSLVLVVLLTFAMGVAVGVLGMIPWRWRQRHLAQPKDVVSTASNTPAHSDAPTMVQPAYSDGL